MPIRSGDGLCRSAQQPLHRRGQLVAHNPGQSKGASGADDLTVIGGIGPKIADRLNAAGIRTYAELASRTADDIVMVLPDVGGLSPARLDNWRDQARKLAPATATSSAHAVPGSPATAPGDGQHYESFVVRVLLNKDGSIRRTTAQHIRTGAERHWPGLGHEALPEFINAMISSPAPSAPTPVGQPPDNGDQPEEPPTTVTPPLGEPRPVAARGGLAGTPRLRLMSSADISLERIVLRAAEGFTVTMTIDLEGPKADGGRLAYNAVVVAKPLAGGPKRTVAQSDGMLPAASSAIRIDAAGLPPGAYRLDGAVSLREPGGDHPV